MKKVDVLVVGAGPTGLLMAAEIARYGLTCRLVDKGVTYRDESRAVALQSRTLEIFDHIDIIDAFLAEGIPVIAANPISGEKRLSRITFDSIDSPYPFVLSLEQKKTEAILENYALSHGVKVERGVEFISLDQKDNDVQVMLNNETILASWVIGCDGAHSSIRKALKIPFQGKSFSDTFSLADVHIDWSYVHNEVFAFLNASGILAALPLPEANRYRLILQYQRGSHPTVPTLKEIEDRLSSYVGKSVKLYDPVWIANFSINSRMAATYQQGRVFLAGDAAHIHSPIGGQGMNTGLQDAFNLAWKIAFVQQNKADSSLLETYNLERGYVGKRLLRATELASKMAILKNPIAIHLRNFCISRLTKIPRVRHALVGALSQTQIRYPNAGPRAPNAPLLGQDLYTHFRGTNRYHALLFSGPKKNNLAPLIEQCPIKPLVITYGENDPTGEAHRIYRVRKPTLVIIRPDIYISSLNNSSKL